MRRARLFTSAFLPLVLAVSTLSAISVVTAPIARANPTDANCAPLVSGLSASAVASGSDCIITFSSGSGTWTVPNGITSIAIVVVGGGGGGGGDGGSGGGGGELRFNSTQSVTAGANATISIGGGGAGGSWSLGTGSSPGSDTTISGAGLTYTAKGGTGGSGWTSTTGGAGGTGGTGGSGNNGAAGGGGPGNCAPPHSASRVVGNLYFGANGPDGPSTTVINSSGVRYGGGGGGGLGADTNNLGDAGRGSAGGLGGGGRGSNYKFAPGDSLTAVDGASAGQSGTANTGGGGGAGAACNSRGAMNLGYDGVSQRTAGGAGGSGVVVVRFTAPTLTTPSTPDLTADSDTGTSQTDNYTNDTTPTFTGTAAAGSTIQLQIGSGSPVVYANTGSTCLTNSSGVWTCTTGTLGTFLLSNSFRVVSTFNFGTSTTSSALVMTIISGAFSEPGTITRTNGSGTLGNGETASIRFQTSRPIYGFTVDDLTVSGGTISNFVEVNARDFTATFTPLANASGTASISVGANKVADQAGNTHSGSATFTIAYNTFAGCSPSTTSSGGFTYVAFKNVGSCNWTPPTNVSLIDLLVVAGGGGGGSRHAGGGGAGGLINATSVTTNGSALLVTVGAGGAGGPAQSSGGASGSSGSSSVVSGGGITTRTANGGGGGGYGADAGGAGGSGGGGGNSGAGGAGSQGNAGSAGSTSNPSWWVGGGGGGAGGAGTTSGSTKAGSGGAGLEISWIPTAVGGTLGVGTTGSTGRVFAGGGGGGSDRNTIAGGDAGTGGGGAGSTGTATPGAGGANTGGGGGGAGISGGGTLTGGAGGTGLIVIRYVNAPTISLSTSTISAIVGTAVTGYTVNSSGGPVTSYAISPSLAVAGLSFSTTTGQISGTPTATAASASYTVTATNTSGTSAATFSLAATFTPCSPTSVISGGFTVLTFLAGAACGWTVPEGVTSAEVLVVGGGGGGNRGVCGVNYGAGAGGGGVSLSTRSLTPGNSISIIVGAGGAAALINCNGTRISDNAAGFTPDSGTNGGSSTFDTVSVNGGVAPDRASTTGGASGNSIAGGTIGSSGTSCGTHSNNCGAGGGGGAQSAGSGLTGGAGVTTSISGTSTMYGGGGPGRNNTSGTPTAISGDGKYGANATPTANTGGGGSDVTAGAAGVVIVKYAMAAVVITTPTTGLTGTVGAAYSLTLAKSGGSGTGTFSIASGTLPAGLTLDAATGVISGTPTAGGTFAITARITDTNTTVATTSSFSFVIGKANQTAISAAVLSATSKAFPYSQTPLTVTSVTGGSSTGGLSITSVANGSATGCAWDGTTLTASTSGTCTLTVTKAADTNYEATTTTATFTFNKASTTTVITCSNQTYTGSALTPCTAAVTGAGGLSTTTTVTYTNNTNAGTATADATYAESTNHLASTATQVSFTIAKAASTTVITCSNQTYTGSALTPCTAAVTGAGGLSTTTTVTYASNTNAGTATANATYATSTNHLASTATQVSFTIAKAASTTVITCSNQTYTGSALTPCTAAVTGAGGLTTTATVTYTSNTNTGTATANATYAESTNHLTSTATPVTFTIGKASSTTVITCSNQTYTGSALTPCTAAVTGAGGLSTTTTVTYTNNTNAGTATANATYAESTNHLGSTATQVTFTIGKASSTTVITCSNQTYTGSALTPCTAAVTGVGGLSTTVTITYTNNINAGTATANATYTESTNHLGSTATQATFTIAKAASTTVITCSNQTYTGSALTPCTAAVTGAGGLNTSATVTYANNTNAGTATANATYAESTNHLASTATQVSFTIARASTTTVITCSNQTYTGSTLTPCTAAVTGAGGLTTTATVTYTSNTNAGTATANATYAQSTNHLASTATQVTFTIAKAASTTVITCSNQTYTGSALTPCTAAVTGAGGLSTTTTVTYASNTNAGTATANATYAESTNHLASTATQVTFTIGKASTTTVITCSNQTYTGSALTPCTAAVTGAGGLSTSTTVIYASNTNAGTATANATYTESTNHLGSTATQATFTIAKAAQTITFGSLNNKTLGSGTYAISASASSTLTVTFTSVTTPVCTISSSTITLVSAGTCTINANQIGNTNYLAATQVQQSFTVATTLLIVTPGGSSLLGTYNTAFNTLTISATGGAGSKTFTATGSLPAGVSLSSAGVISGTPTTAGDFSLTVTATDENGATATTNSFTISIAKAVSTISISIPTYTYTGLGQGPDSATKSGSSGAITYVYAGRGSTTYASSNIKPISVGTYTVTVTVASDSNFASVSATANFEILSASIVITPTISATSMTYGTSTGSLPTISFTKSQDITLTTNPTCSLYLASDTGFLTAQALNSTLVAGSYVLRCAGAALANYTITYGTNPSFTVNKLAITLTVGNPAATAYTGSSVSVTNSFTQTSGTLAGSDSISGVTYTYTSVGGYNSTTAPTSAGTYTITGSNAVFSVGSSSNYEVTYLTGTLTITGAAQSITFTSNQPTGAKVAGVTYTVSATGGASGNAVTFSSLTASVCTVATATVTFVAAGTCTIAANQGSSANYNAASQATQSFAVAKGDPTFSAWSNVSKTFGDSTFTITAPGVTGSLPGTFTYASATPAVISISGTTLTVAGGGTSVITATFTPTDSTNYNNATTTMTVTVSATSQSITRTSTSPLSPVKSGTYTPTATASSTLVVAITIASGSSSVCSITTGVVTFNTVGSCVIEYNQSGNSNYGAAPQVTETLTIGKATPTFSAWSNVSKTFGDSTFTITAPGVTGSLPGTFTYASATPAVISISGTTLTVAGGGTSVITATFTPTDSTNYNNATTTMTVTVSAGTQTVTWAPTTSLLTTASPVTPSVAASALGSAPISYAVTNAGTTGCSVNSSSGVLTFTTAGNCVVTATAAETADYLSATKAVTFVISLATRTLTIDSSSFTTTYTMIVTPPTITATASAGTGAITFSSSTTAVCTINSSTGVVIFVSVGTCTISASIAADSTYGTVASSSISFSTTLAAALTPTFGTVTPTADGFTVSITNHSPDYTWAGTATASGIVTVDSAGLVTVTGVAAGTSSTATITSVRTNYTTGSETVAGTSIPVYTITYAPGIGGSGSAPTTPTSVSFGTTFTTPANTFVKNGFTFAGWNDGTATYQAEVTYPATGTVSGNITLTATWSGNICSPTVTTSGGYTRYTFTSTTTCFWDVPAEVSTVDVLAVAGGAGGGYAWDNTGAGGGAGGQVISIATTLSGTLTVTVGQGGAGGTVSSTRGGSGTNTSIGSITALAGSGGCAARSTCSVTSQATALVGANGGAGGVGGTAGRGGGGSSTVALAPTARTGGTGTTSDYSGSSVVYGTGGTGGAPQAFGVNIPGAAAGANTGNGGGGASAKNASGNVNGGAGGSGFIVVRIANGNTVVFDANTGVGSMANQGIVSGIATALTSNTFTKAGHTFAGWNTNADGTSGTSYSNGQSVTITAGMTLFAKWVLNTYAVTFSGNSGLGTMGAQSVTHGVSTNLNANLFTRANYAFYRWATEVNGSGITYENLSQATFTAATILYAQWTPNTYVVTYNYNNATGGASIASATFVTAGTPIVLPTPTRTGYTFAGWFSDAALTAPIVSTGNNYSPTGSILALIAYAKWTAINYNFTYDSNSADSGTVPTETSKQITQSVTIKANTGSLIRVGYSFSGWNTSSNGTGTNYLSGSQFIVGSSNVILYAKWSPNSYTVTYNNNGATGNAQRDSSDVTSDTYITEDSPISLPGVGTLLRSGYTFGGWNTSAAGTGTNRVEDDLYTTVSDVIFYAKWNPVTYSITYNGNTSNGGTTPAVGGYTTGQTSPYVVVSNTFTKTSNVFGGWNTASNGTGTSYSPGSSITTLVNLVLYAVWIPQYTLHYAINGGSVTSGSLPTDQLYNVGTSVGPVFSSVSRTGYRFDGWANGSSLILPGGNFTILADSVLTAKWTAINYTISYNSDGGSEAPGAFTKQIGESFTVGSAVFKPGYDFAGWWNGSTLVGADAVVVVGSSNISFTAQWIAKVYRITFDWNGGRGTAVDDVLYTFGTSAITLPLVGDRIKDGFTFAGWSQTPTGSLLGARFIPTQSRTLFAIWNVGNFTITYDAGRGTVANSIVPVVNGGSTLLPTPTRLNFVFIGWHTAITGGTLLGFGGTSFTPTASQTIHARWVQSSLYGITDSLTRIGSVVTVDNISNTFSGANSNSAVSVSVPANALPAGTTINFDLVGNSSRATGLLPGINYVVSIAISWLTGDETVPDTASGKPILVTITNSSIKAGAVAYAIVNNVSTLLGTATQDGRITVELTSDPEVVIGATKPTAPLNVVATSNGAQQSVISWSAPSSTGGSVITSYTVTASSGAGTCTTTTTTCTISSLTNGTTYSFTVTATNSVGISDSSAPATATTASLYSVTFDAKSGTPVNSGTFLTSSTVSEPTAPTRNGYVFAGWSLTEGGAIEAFPYAPGVTNNITMFARWDALEHVVVFDSKNGSVVADSVFASGGVVAEPTAPIRSGYTFAGWSATDGGTVITFPYSPGVVNNITLYAKWIIRNTTSLIQNVTVIGDRNVRIPNVGVFTPTSATDLRPVGVQIDEASKKFIADVKVVDGNLVLTPETGFSGKRVVTVSIKENGNDRLIQIPLTVLPEKAIRPVLTPTSERGSTIRWSASPNATGYTVYLNGKKVCSTSITSCAISKVMGPAAQITIISNGGDRTESQKVEADFKQTAPIFVARLVSGTNTKGNLTSVDITALYRVIDLINNQGFRTIEISNISTTKKNESVASERINRIRNFISSKTGNLKLTFTVVPATSRTVFNRISLK